MDEKGIENNNHNNKPQSGKNGQNKKGVIALIEEHYNKAEARDLDEIRNDEHTIINGNLVFSLFILVIITALAMVASDRIKDVTEKLFSFMVNYFDWYYIVISFGFLIFTFYIAISKYGKVVIGNKDDKPEFSDFAWYSMLFSVGIGVALLFWGVAEPLYYFLNPQGPVEDVKEAARQAMVITSYHWGLNGWVTYLMIAIGVACYGAGKRKKFLISSSLVSFTGSRSFNNLFKLITEILITLATIFGMGASLGLGIVIIAMGIKHVFSFDATDPASQIIIGLVITAVYIISATTGIKKGIKAFSMVNTIGILALTLFFFIAGPKIFILKTFFDTLGNYISQIIKLGLSVSPLKPDSGGWMGEWSLMYFSWWIVWAPFVGIFMARISRGRTVRQLIFGALVVPVIFSILWFSIFGGAAIYNQVNNTPHAVGHILEGPGKEQSAVIAMFEALKFYPGYEITSVFILILMFIMLITSADSATYVLALVTTEGDKEPKWKMKVLWGAIMAVLTLALLIGGGLKPFKAVILLCAVPLSLVLILISIISLARLHRHYKKTCAATNGEK